MILQSSVIFISMIYQLKIQEIRLVIHNSHLVNALLCELSEMVAPYEGSQYLDLGTAYVYLIFYKLEDLLFNVLLSNKRSVLEKHLRSLTDNVDELLQDTNKFNIYQRQVVKQQQEKQKYIQKRVSYTFLLIIFSIFNALSLRRFIEFRK